MQKSIDVISIEYLTHDVIRLRVEKPKNYNYQLGQATEISFKNVEDDSYKSIFTITSLPKDDFLEFIIKIGNFQSKFLLKLKETEAGEKMEVSEPFGGIEYKGEGVFIAGGVGIAPFIPIFRDLKEKGLIGQSTLIFANRTESDIMMMDYFKTLLGDNFINILSEQQHPEYDFGFVTAGYIQKNNLNDLKYFYLCGPKPMLDNIESGLLELNIEKENIIKEGF